MAFGPDAMKRPLGLLTSPLGLRLWCEMDIWGWNLRLKVAVQAGGYQYYTFMDILCLAV